MKARVRARQGQEQQATELLEWALDTDPDNPQYYILLFGYYNERQKPEEGLQRVHHFASKYQEKAAAWRALMQIAVSQNDIDNVKKFAEEALVRAQPREKQDLLAEISWHYGQAKPRVILFNTLMGKGVPFLETRDKNHFIRVDPPEWQQALAILDQTAPEGAAA